MRKAGVRRVARRVAAGCLLVLASNGVVPGTTCGVEAPGGTVSLIDLPRPQSSDEILDLFERAKKRPEMRTRGGRPAGPASSGAVYRGVAVVERPEGGRTMSPETIDYDSLAAFRIRFAFGSSEISTQSHRILEEIARALRHPSLAGNRFFVNGHTDSVGPEEYNFRLSYARALAVRNFLASEYGVPAERLQPRGFGEKAPVPGTSDSAADRACNRRVEIELAR